MEGQKESTLKNIHVLDGTKETVQELVLGSLCPLENKVLCRLDSIEQRVVLIAGSGQDEDMVRRPLIERHCEEELNRGVVSLCLFLSLARAWGGGGGQSDPCLVVKMEDEYCKRQDECVRNTTRVYDSVSGGER